MGGAAEAVGAALVAARTPTTIIPVGATDPPSFLRRQEPRHTQSTLAEGYARPEIPYLAPIVRN